ncbi:MAG: hypothetical protein M1840_004324 [Geoglossum simile]|nr:MAG: hypothetical protein M1840_004324 [Geoglossum simile]
MAADAPTGVWKIVTEHANAFQAVESGPDDPELIGRPDDLVDASTKVEFIRLDEKAEREEGPNGYLGPPTVVLKPSEPFSKLGGPLGASAEQASKWAEYAFIVRRVFNANNMPVCVYIDFQSRYLKEILKLVFWETQYSPHFMDHR